MIKIFITLGPASMNKSFLSNLNKKYIKLLRINLSHTNIIDLEKTVKYIRKYTNIPISFDTEGAQVRTSVLKKKTMSLRKNSNIIINKQIKNKDGLDLNPQDIYKELKINDILSIDFDGVKIKIIAESDTLFKCKVIEGGVIGTNKSILVNRKISIPAFTKKDIQAFDIAQKLKIKNVALSFTSCAQDIKRLREYFTYPIKITSKIESLKAIMNLKEIMNEADNILIDRGDLSKEVPIHLIPRTQKNIVMAAQKNNTPVYVATNLLESMVTQKEPTRAEVNDIYNTLNDGATGLVLAAETAIGKYPSECVNMVIDVSKTL
ncbi:MAG: hypothetical protein HOJ33_05340 [Gammaproteobacteria bacterium]|nr:hypothetical protein [Gammaproteobacteria bacterium]